MLETSVMEQEDLPYTVKYQPKTLNDIIGHATLVGQVKEWIESWKEGSKQKPLLLHGKAGMGKTSLVQALVNDYDLEILELNASDTRNSKAIERIAGHASSAMTFSGKMRLILFDEVDGLFIQDRGGGSSINKILKESNYPIILTANDAWNSKLATIRKQCNVIEVRKVHYSTISKLLQNIAMSEEIQVHIDTLKELSKNAQGDVRSAVNDFEFLSSSRDKKVVLEDVQLLSQRDRIENSMFNVTQKILKTMDFKEATRSTYNLKERPDFVLKWVAENIPKEYKKPKDLYDGYQQLSKADIFLGRVFRRQNYGFWRYAGVLMTAGVALSKESKYHGFTRYSFPSFISYLGRTKGSRGARKSVAQKIGKFCHVSTKRAIQDYLPMFKELMKDEKIAVDFAYNLKFDEDDLGFFKITPAKTKKILEKVDEIRNISIKERQIDKNQHSLNQFF